MLGRIQQRMERKKMHQQQSFGGSVGPGAGIAIEEFGQTFTGNLRMCFIEEFDRILHVFLNIFGIRISDCT
jgi:hypothetical protein